MLHWAQIKLSASVPTCPEGVTTHTLLSYGQTPLHAAGFTVAAKGQSREVEGGVTWRENVGQRDAKRRRGKEKEGKKSANGYPEEKGARERMRE